MTTTLNQLKDNDGARKNATRVGRGIGSGKGKTCGRGHKGQKSRSGVAIKGFEGGQMPIHRRLPKRGFNNYNRKTFEPINIGVIQSFIDAKKLKAGTITRDALIEAGVAKGNEDGIKLLSKGELTAKVSIEVDAASKAAITAVEKAGGKVTLAQDKKAEPAGDKPKKETKKADKK